jgi:DNA-binding MarR family transcriptional regulator
MRKMILELGLKPPLDKIMEQALSNVESYTIIEMVRIDFHRGIKVGIMEVTMKEGFTIGDLTFPPPAQVVSVIQSSGQTHTCVVQVQAPKEMLGMFRQFDLDLIWDTPMGFSGDTLVLSVVGEDEELRKLMDVIDTIGEVMEMHVQQASFHQEDILANLTDRQREVLVAAKRYGYYDYPRRMNAEELSKRVGVSKATVVEHLRKAEGRLMASLLAGY